MIRFLLAAVVAAALCLSVHLRLLGCGTRNDSFRPVEVSAVPDEGPLAGASLQNDNRPAQAVSEKPETPFHWRQLESSSYPEYISNLRAIGCPEITIADIINADVHALYSDQRERLVRATQDGVGDSETERAACAQALRDLHQEEQRVLLALLGSRAHLSDYVQQESIRMPGGCSPLRETGGSVLGSDVGDSNAQTSAVEGSSRVPVDVWRVILQIDHALSGLTSSHGISLDTVQELRDGLEALVARLADGTSVDRDEHEDQEWNGAYVAPPQTGMQESDLDEEQTTPANCR